MKLEKLSNKGSVKFVDIFAIFLIGFVISVFVGFFITIDRANEFCKITHENTSEIIALNNDKEISGYKGFVYCYVSDSYVQYWTQDNKEIIPHKTDLSNTRIFEDVSNGEAPYVIEKCNNNNKVVEVEIHIQEGTLKREITLE